MEFIIREATREDSYENASCHIASWRSAYRGIVPDKYLNDLSVEHRSERFRRILIELKDYCYYCAGYNNKIVGILIIGKSRDKDKLNAGEVCAIYLVEEFWGKGYGKEMMQYALNTLRSMHYKEVILWVLEENNRARCFYEKCNFTFDGTKKEIQIGKTLMEVRYGITL